MRQVGQLYIRTDVQSASARLTLYACGCLLYVLWEKSSFLSCQQPAPEVLDRGKLHFLSVFTVNIQEDAKEHQKAAPDVPAEGETERLGIFKGQHKWSGLQNANKDRWSRAGTNKMVMERLDQLEECQQIKREQKQSTFQTLQKVYEEGNGFSTFVRYLLELVDRETGWVE